MNFYRKQFNYLIYAYVIMPDHFHWIIRPNDTRAEAPSTRRDNKSITTSRVVGSLEPMHIPLIMGRLKGRTAYEINKLLKRKGKLWQENYYEHVIRNQLDFEEKINYIHKNPYRSGLTQELENYKYSSYTNYYLGDNSLIKIDYPNFDVIRK